MGGRGAANAPLSIKILIHKYYNSPKAVLCICMCLCMYTVVCVECFYVHVHVGPTHYKMTR